MLSLFPSQTRRMQMHGRAASQGQLFAKRGGLSVKEAVSTIISQLYTLYLFTRSDIKTVMLPVTTLALFAAPPGSLSARSFCSSIFWLWCHLLQCDLANQTTNDPGEDSAIRPWRPLAAGRISRRDAITLRWVVCAWCITLSAFWMAPDVLLVSVLFAMDNYLHNDLRWSDHWLKKNVCNGVAYGLFEWGATRVAAGGWPLDDGAKTSVLVSALVIITTIQMQDFADVRGDRAAGRATLPIRFPTASRAFTAALLSWSLGLGVLWGLSPILHARMLNSDHHHDAPRGTVRPRAPAVPATPSRQDADVFTSSPGDTPARRKLTKITASGDGSGSKLYIIPPVRNPKTTFTTLDCSTLGEDDPFECFVPPNMKARQILANWENTADILTDVCWITLSQHWTTGDLELIDRLFYPARVLFQHLARLRQRAGVVEHDIGDGVGFITDPGAAAPPSSDCPATPSPPATPTKPNTAAPPPRMLTDAGMDPNTTPKAPRPGPQDLGVQAPPAALPPGRAPPTAAQPRLHGDAPHARPKEARPNEERRSRSRPAKDRTRARAHDAHAVPPSKNRPRHSANRLVCSFADPAAARPGPRPRPHPASLVAAVNRALPAPLVSAVDYSRLGRLILLTTDPVRASQLLPYEEQIRRVLCEVFKLRLDADISLELDVEWTRVVIHNAPLPIGPAQDDFWPALCAAAGLDCSSVKLRRFLCPRDELDRRMRDSSAANGQAVSVMLAISDPKAAARVLRSDVLWQGSVCRTALYRPRSPPSSQPTFVSPP